MLHGIDDLRRQQTRKTMKMTPRTRRTLAVALATGLLAGTPDAGATPADDVTATIDAAIASGDGRSADTAYSVPGMLWEYKVLHRLGLRLVRQRTDEATKDDVITVRDPKAGTERTVWFQATNPSEPKYAEIDRVARAIVTSGDGGTPETAFAVGGFIESEYMVAQVMGVDVQRQALLRYQGCSFDRLSGKDVDDGHPRSLYFKLGSTPLDNGGPCRTKPKP